MANDYYYEGKGIGSSKKGIPLEHIKDPKVTANLTESPDTYFGYLANDKSAYKSMNESFKNENIVKKYREQRVNYIKSSLAEIERITQALNNKTPLVGIAFNCVEARNEAKIIAREEMDPKDVAELEKRNMEMYFNPVGPDLDTAIILNQSKIEGIPKNKLKQMMEISEISLNKDDKPDDWGKLTDEELELNKEYNEMYQRALANAENDLNAYKRIILSSLKKDEEACVLLGIDPEQVSKVFKKYTSGKLFG